MKPFLLTWLLLVILLCPVPSLFASQNFTLSGIVQDGSGARISHAHVAVREASSSMSFKAESSEQGEFSVSIPATGNYQIEVTAGGFAPLTVPVVLTEQAPAAMVKLILKVAEHSETVQVTADALVAETTSTQLGETLASGKIEGVPLNGRNFTDLMAVQPGIVPANTAQPGAVIMTGVAATPPSGRCQPRQPLHQRPAREFEWLPR